MKLLEKGIVYLLSVLAFILPLQNPILQYLTQIVQITPYIALYKDALLVVLLGCICVDVFHKKAWKSILCRTLLGLLALLHVVILIISIYNTTSIRALVFGYYFEVWWVVVSVMVFIWFTSVSKTVQTYVCNTLSKTLAIGFLCIALFSVAVQVFGQSAILPFFGYGQERAGLVSSTIVCHPIDFEIETCRNAGTFAHPIQFATYVIILIPLLLSYLAVKGKKAEMIGIGTLSLLLLYWSGTRFALMSIAAAAGSILIYILYLYILKRGIRSQIITFSLRKLAIIAILIPTFAGQLLLTSDPAWLSNYVPPALAKPSSTVWHYRHFQSTLDIIKDSNPDHYILGYGLGSIGSAAREKYQDYEENPIAFEFEYVAYRWGFVRETYLLTENWLLQAFINGGVIYCILYLLLLCIPLYPFLVEMLKKRVFMLSSLLVFLSGFAVLNGNLLQHIWESQPIAYLWTIIGMYAIYYYNINQDTHGTSQE